MVRLGRHGHGPWIPARAGAFLAAFLALLAIGVAIVAWTKPGATVVDLERGEPTTLVEPTLGGATEAERDSRVVVHVTGAVATPGVFELAGGTRVDDAIEAAGGFVPDADESLLNRAEVLRDGQQVFVPKVGQEPRADADLGAESAGPVNINTASAARLEDLPGIGPALAQRIVAHREANGPFTSAEGLTAVSGIGTRTLEGMIDMVTW